LKANVPGSTAAGLIVLAHLPDAFYSLLQLADSRAKLHASLQTLALASNSTPPSLHPDALIGCCCWLSVKPSCTQA